MLIMWADIIIYVSCRPLYFIHSIPHPYCILWTGVSLSVVFPSLLFFPLFTSFLSFCMLYTLLSPYPSQPLNCPSVLSLHDLQVISLHTQVVVHGAAQTFSPILEVFLLPPFVLGLASLTLQESVFPVCLSAV